MTQYTRNILKVYKQCTSDEIQHGMTWYADAKSDAQSMADKYELPLHIVVGVIAALSPTNRWERNLIDADNMLDVFVSGGYVESCTPCTYKTMRDKAWSILQTTPHDADAVAFILKGPKITDFFYCIMGENVCVIDGHAWCIANNDRRTMQEVPSIGKKLRAELQECYRRAAKKHGITAYQMQAATWVAWKRIHNV
tara:strand:+ start:564 stop:1151 length:588 start_codon:yes stop_codon:yes gene_type:complete